MSLPLEGVRVLDLSRLLPGGFCSLLLADFGADVLKVEDTGMGDYIRWSPPYVEGAEDSAKSALFLSLNRNKRSIRLDLKNERGREALLALVRRHDVVLESFRPGVLDRLGVGYERMREVNQGIIYCAISGYGQTGPKREAAGHDMNYLGLIGLLGLTGEAGGGVGGGPIQSAGQIADLGGGSLMAAFGIMAALHERDGAPARGERPARPGSGEGQIVDVSMADGALSWLAMVAGAYFADGTVPHRGQLPLAGSLICYRPYECADGWVTLGALEPKFWQAFCRGVEREDLIERQFESPGSEAHAEVQAIFRARARAEWEEFARTHDCCLEPVLDLDEALESELVQAREMVVEIDQPGAAQAVRQLGLPVKLDRTPGDHRRLPGPALGEHTAQALSEAGYTDEQIAELLECGAVAGTAQSTPQATFRA
jgi:crotonobetainyl-CoA:carnitine CoA-transferase CaiB-like acyl-CoA transferase